jgi:cob(I)alamin adenosyltransferase
MPYAYVTRAFAVNGGSRKGMKLDRIYTRGGDGGETSLGDGTRVPKYSVRVRAMGSIDEANAAMGVAALHLGSELRDIIMRVQNDLFDVGADLCVPQHESSRQRLRVSAPQVSAIEREIDRLNEGLAPLTSFVLPGGSPASAWLHFARTVARRAERDVAEVAAGEPLNPELVKYLNRLSDLLFVLARHANQRGATDVLWQPGLNR